MYNSGTKNAYPDIRERTFRFGVRVVKLVLALRKNPGGFEIGNQLIRSGTSVGANVEEAQNCGSKKEFVRCLTISLKEARETRYWIRILIETELIEKLKLEPLLEESLEIIKILTVIIKKSKANSKNSH